MEPGQDDDNDEPPPRGLVVLVHFLCKTFCKEWSKKEASLIIIISCFPLRVCPASGDTLSVIRQSVGSGSDLQGALVGVVVECHLDFVCDCEALKSVASCKFRVASDEFQVYELQQWTRRWLLQVSLKSGFYLIGANEARHLTESCASFRVCLMQIWSIVYVSIWLVQ